MTPHEMNGQSSIEVLVVIAALAIALFVPFLDQGPVFIVLARALMGCFSAQSFVMSIL
jgi:hypothetical protein